MYHFISYKININVFREIFCTNKINDLTYWFLKYKYQYFLDGCDVLSAGLRICWHQPLLSFKTHHKRIFESMCLHQK